MNMTLTLNGKLINATQCTDKYQSIPGAVRCSIGHAIDGERLHPLPPKIQAFGRTEKGVLVQGGEYKELNEGDWYLIRNGETQGIIMDNATFNYVFKDELGI